MRQDEAQKGANMLGAGVSLGRTTRGILLVLAGITVLASFLPWFELGAESDRYLDAFVPVRPSAWHSLLGILVVAGAVLGAGLSFVDGAVRRQLPAIAVVIGAVAGVGRLLLPLRTTVLGDHLRYTRTSWLVVAVVAVVVEATVVVIATGLTAKRSVR